MNKIPAYSSAVLAAAVLALAAGCVGDGGSSDIQEPAGPAPSAAVSAKHILVQYEGSMRASPDVTRSKEEALVRIQECLERAKQGEKFEDLAMEYSDGPSAPKGGDLGEFGRGMMHPAFEEASFALEVDGLSDVVETPFGYHIIRRYK